MLTSKPWPWPGLTSFSRPRFPGKPGQDLGKPGLAGLGQVCHAFDRAPDARVVCNVKKITLANILSYVKYCQENWLRGWKPYCNIYVVVQYPWFNSYFVLFWGMIMYDSEIKQRAIIFKQRITLNPNLHTVCDIPCICTSKFYPKIKCLCY